MVMAGIVPSGMLFVRDRDGISHSPLEWVAPDDVAAGSLALFHYLQTQLDAAHGRNGVRT